MEYDDISNEVSEVPLINKKYKSKTELFIYGVTLDRNYKKVIDYYTVEAPPGFSGPEVVSKDVLPMETMIEIEKSQRCNNCFPFSAKERLVIKVISNPKYKGNLVAIDKKTLSVGENGIFTKIE